MITTRGLAAAAMVAAAMPGAALAADADGKWLSGSVSIEMQHDRILGADDGIEGSDTYFTIEPVVTVHVTPELTLTLGATLEPVRDAEPDDDRVFTDHGVYLDTLVLSYDSDNYGVYGGKFTPIFGMPDMMPGMYGDSFSADYELVERWGVGGSIALAAEGIGTTTIHASVFTRDDTVLSESAITNRGAFTRADGGAGNTEVPENFAIAVDFEPAAAEGLLLRGSVLRQGAGEGESGDQVAFSLGASYEVQVTEDVTVVPVIDYVHSFDGIGLAEGTVISGADQDYLTAGLGASYGSWFGNITGGVRLTSEPDADDVDDHFVQVSAGYAFDFGLSVEAGWIGYQVDGVSADAVGVVLAYGLEF